MSELAPRQLVDDLVLANHILSNEGVLDAFGHVSARPPTTSDRFLISHTRAPELVEAGDLQLLDLVLMRGHGCVVTGTDLRAAVFAAVYLERNATLLAVALGLGEVRALSAAETQRASEMLRGRAGERAWEYWVRRLPPS